jgi:hypothetical protein
MPSDVIASIAIYRNDVIAALRLYFSSVPPHYEEQFLGYNPQEVLDKLNAFTKARIEETDLRSSLAILASLEAIFRLDYKYRREKKVKGSLFRAFRDIHKSRERFVRLDEDIFEAWEQNVPESQKLIRALRGAFKFRHWLAHGCSWVLKGGQYDFESLYDLAINVLTTLDFVSLD